MLPAARTRDEAHLYMDLHACPQCGDVEVTWAESLVDADGVLARRYHGTCAQCGLEREFLFAVPDRPTPPRADERYTFGADEDASELFDAGQWFAIAEMMALAADLQEDDPAEQLESLSVAIAAVDEILKFVPAGGDEAPAAAFWTPEGLAEHDRDPSRLRRPALEARRRELAERLATR